MEEIEYLEEYEDFILPNEKKCTGDLVADRRSVDSLEGLYNELIGESPEAQSISEYTTNLDRTVDKTTVLETESVTVSSNVHQTTKSSTNSAYTNIELQLPLYRAHINRATNKHFPTSSSVLQRPEKLKSVATVKPTLQRITNPSKTVRNRNTPLKHATFGSSINHSSEASRSSSQSISKNNVPQKHAAIISNPFQTTVDPLSLEDNCGLLDFDFDKQCLVDDFDFDSDMDNSIIGGISDLDSVDLSDEFSEGNFDIESDLSSEISAAKKERNKKKKKTDANLEKSANSIKNKPGSVSAEHDRKKGQLKRPQQKAIPTDKTLSQLLFEKRKEHSAGDEYQPTYNKMENAPMPAMLKSSQPVINDILPKVSPQEDTNLNDYVDKNLSIVLSSNTTGAASPNCSRDSPAVLTSPADNNSSGIVKTYVNKKRLSNNDETVTQIQNEYASGCSIDKVTPDSNPLQFTQRSLEPPTPDKSVRMKLGSYLKSIKPPVGKDPIIRKLQQQDKSSAKIDPIVMKSPQIDETCITDKIVNTNVLNDEPNISKNLVSSEKKALPADEPIQPEVFDPIRKINESNTSQKTSITLEKTPKKDASNIFQLSNPDEITSPLIAENKPLNVHEEKIPQKEESQKSHQVEKQPLQKEVPSPSQKSKKILQTDLSNRPKQSEELVKDGTQKAVTLSKESPQNDLPKKVEKADLTAEKPTQADEIGLSQQTEIIKTSEKEAKDDAPQQEEQCKNQTTTSITKCTELKQKIMTRRQVPESNTSTASKESDNGVLASKSGEQEVQKSTHLNVDKLNRKIKETNDSRTIAKSGRQSIKLRKSSSDILDKKPSNSGSVDSPEVSNGKDSERVVFSTNALQQRRLGYITRENNRLKENIVQKNIPLKESTAEKETKSPRLNEKLATRLFSIRLDRNAVAKFLLALENPANSNTQIVSKTPRDQTTENTFKRKVYDVPKFAATDDESQEKMENPFKRRILVVQKAGPVTLSAKTFSENIQDKTDNIQGQMSLKDVPTKVVETLKKPDITSSIIKGNTQTKETKKRKRNRTSWKHKKKIKSTVPPKILRSSRPIIKPVVIKKSISRNIIPEPKSDVFKKKIPAKDNVADSQPSKKRVKSLSQPRLLRQLTRRPVETAKERSRKRESLRTNPKKPDSDDKNSELISKIDAESSHALQDLNASIEAVPKKRILSLADVTKGLGHSDMATHVTIKEAEKPSQLQSQTVEPSKKSINRLPSRPDESQKKNPSRPSRRHCKKLASENIESCEQGNSSRAVEANASSQNIVTGPTEKNISNTQNNGIHPNLEVDESIAQRCPLLTNVSDQVAPTESPDVTYKEVEQSNQSPSNLYLRRHPRKQLHPENNNPPLLREASPSHQLDTTSTLPPVPVIEAESTRNANVQPTVSKISPNPVDLEISNVDFVQPKSEYRGCNDNYIQYDGCHKNTNHTNGDSDITVYELPSFIVMRTKLITSKDINNTYVPTVIKKNFDKLSEERQPPPIVKVERTDFKDVCLEINDLLANNGNYLKFASSVERLQRMNQVLSDSSLTVKDAQCTLKFLQSYLCLRSKPSKEGVVRTKGQQFIPIYDSQKKIIGYRKRTIHTKKSYNSTNSRSVFGRTSNMSQRSFSSRTNATNNGSFNASSAGYEKQVVERVVQFEPKKEPQVMDDGDQEVIVPDVEPASEPCIKHESDAILC